MLTNYEREVATTLVEALVEYGLNEHLAQYGEHSTEDWFVDECLGAMGFWASGGASKVCIGHKDLRGWVIKVGYTEKVSIDYATREYEVYVMAEEEGLAHYFPVTIFLGKFGGRAFYIQEYADCDENQVSSDWYERLADHYNELEEEYDSDQIWTDIDCMDDWEKIEMIFHNERLCNFLADHRVGDFHEGNFGYIGGCMVIVDFAGWRG